MNGFPAARVLLWGMITLAVVLALLALLGWPPPAAAKVKAPSTHLVTSRLHDALERALDDYGMLVASGYLTVSCQPGTRGDATRRVRWFCYAEQRDEVGERVYYTRLRVRAKRGAMRTALDWHGWGRVRLNSGWYVDTGRLL